jgi:hypothetical protein
VPFLIFGALFFRLLSILINLSISWSPDYRTCRFLPWGYQYLSRGISTTIAAALQSPSQ